MLDILPEIGTVPEVIVKIINLHRLPILFSHPHFHLLGFCQFRLLIGIRLLSFWGKSSTHLRPNFALNSLKAAHFEKFRFGSVLVFLELSSMFVLALPHILEILLLVILGKRCPVFRRKDPTDL